MPIAVPRDREGSFEPELVKKGQTRIDGMDDKIIDMPLRSCHLAVSSVPNSEHDADLPG